MANDLYSGLIQPYLRKGSNGEQFWGLYDPLDSVSAPDSSVFLRTQIAGLRALEQSGKYAATNAFLQKAQGLLSDHESNSEEKLGNEVYSRIIELLNSGLRSSSINPYKGFKKGKTDKSVVTQRINNIVTELSSLLAQVGINGSVSARAVDILEQQLNNFSWDHVSYDYIMEKADIVEAIMVEMINQNPALKAVVTGAWMDMSGKQLIEDAFAFNRGSIDTPFGELKYEIKVEGGEFSEGSATSIGDFLKQLESLNGKDFKVKISDELYEALKAGSVIAGQAKSGQHGQAILNKNKRNSMSLGEAGWDPMLLWDLYCADMAERTSYFKPEGAQNSATLEALANYCLSKSIAKTALADNQLYLTAEGFVTASQWMDLNGRYLIFSPAVRSVGGDFLTRSRPYVFTD